MYDWDPRVYSKSSSEQQRWARELFSRLKLRGDESILDIGCGDGKVTAELAALVPEGRVLGIDSSLKMISYARENHPPTSHPNLEFQEGDATRLGFSACFDRVVSFACLHWVKDHPAVLRGVKNSLRPRGRLLIQCGGRGNAAQVFEAARELIALDRWSRYFRGFQEPYYFYGPEGYGRWLEEAGLRPLRVELVGKDMAQPGREGFVNWIRSTWHPYLERLPPELCQDFIDQLADRYMERHPPDERGLVHTPMFRLEVEAENPTLSGEGQRGAGQSRSFGSGAPTPGARGHHIRRLLLISSEEDKNIRRYSPQKSGSRQERGLMLKHIVIFKLKDFAEGASKAKNIEILKNRLEALQDTIEEIKYFEVGVNSIDSDVAYDMALTSSFDDQSSLRRYQKHPDHQKVVELVGKICESRWVVDYDYNGHGK
ncbi:MAG: methyltransferase domain-containing protein [Methanosarcinales archaeon]|nr:methyltransferase domain-containing protein [Methanosarcinales archaeon]